jgi:predicted nucleotidyltransferase
MTILDLSSLDFALASLNRGLTRALPAPQDEPPGGRHKQIELSTHQLHMIRQILQRRLPGRQARAFGSRVTGAAKPWSDLDLVLLGEQPASDLALAETRADFEESDLPFRVDLSEWRDLPASLRQHITEQGVSV